MAVGKASRQRHDLAATSAARQLPPGPAPAPTRTAIFQATAAISRGRAARRPVANAREPACTGMVSGPVVAEVERRIEAVIVPAEVSGRREDDADRQRHRDLAPRALGERCGRTTRPRRTRARTPRPVTLVSPATASSRAAPITRARAPLLAGSAPRAATRRPTRAPPPATPRKRAVAEYGHRDGGAAEQQRQHQGCGRRRRDRRGPLDRNRPRPERQQWRCLAA